MNKFWKKVEHYNSKLIPFAVAALLLVIIFELFIHTENHSIELSITILDYLVITIFIIDLIFLWIKSKHIKYFFQHYWLDIIAIFPFIIFFNLINNLYRAVIATERFVIAQAILHETLEAGKGVEGVAKSGSKVGKFIRISARSIRIVTKSRLFKRFKSAHNRTKKKIKGRKRK